MSRYIDLDQTEFFKVDENKEFNHGVDCCINRLLEAEPIKVVSLDRVKKVGEEIQKAIDKIGNDTMTDIYMKIGLDLALTILNELITESEVEE